jgi:hypothetical protein
MDYVTRQFINLTKKLRDDVRKSFASLHNDLTHLADGVKNLKDAISTQRQTDEKSQEINPGITITDFQTQIPIRVRTQAQYSTRERIWRGFKGAFEIVGIIAVILYTGVTYEMWQESRDTTNFVARQTELARKGLNETVKNFRTDERAWVGIAGMKPDQPNQFPYSTTFTWLYKNYGKTPATEVVTTDNAHVYGEHFPDHPLYESKIPSPEFNSRVTLFPGQQNGLDGSSYVCQQHIDEIKGGGKWCYTYGIITYKDEFGVKHTTHFCYRHGINPLGRSSDLCDTYNDAD